MSTSTTVSGASSVPLAARTDVSALAGLAVGRARRAAAHLAGAEMRSALDGERIAAAFTSERWLRIDGSSVPAFAPLSGFFETRDGWVRTHANYPHHRARLLRAFGLPDDASRDELSDCLSRMDTDLATATVSEAGGLCVAVRPADRTADGIRDRTPLVDVERLDDSPARPLPRGRRDAPLRGIRVLDLTRVIAGPVATRTLALLGTEVLRIDPPGLAELPSLHLDTGHGKRSAVLDLRHPASARRFERLLDRADVITLGYRPVALQRLGLDPALLAARRPGIIVLQLSAWGGTGASSGDRRGFDSLVQAESGIALVEREHAHAAPGVLPAQALDHSAGYLLAATAMELLDRRGREGGAWLAQTSLRRMAAKLLSLPRTTDPTPAGASIDPAGHTQDFTVGGQVVTTVAPAFSYPGGPAGFAAPRPWGQDEPQWVDGAD